MNPDPSPAKCYPLVISPFFPPPGAPPDGRSEAGSSCRRQSAKGENGSGRWSSIFDQYFQVVRDVRPFLTRQQVSREIEYKVDRANMFFSAICHICTNSTPWLCFPVHHLMLNSTFPWFYCFPFTGGDSWTGKTTITGARTKWKINSEQSQRWSIKKCEEEVNKKEGKGEKYLKKLKWKWQTGYSCQRRRKTVGCLAVSPNPLWKPSSQAGEKKLTSRWNF